MKKTNDSRRITGKITTTGKGLGFVNDELLPLPEDIMIEAGYLNTAMNGDIVEVAFHTQIPGERLTGEVTRVITRGRQTFVGTIEIKQERAFVTPDDRRAYADIFIPISKIDSAQNGDKIVKLEGGKIVSFGVLHSAVPGNDFCNGNIAIIQSANDYACMCDCLHVDDVASVLADAGLDKRPVSK